MQATTSPAKPAQSNRQENEQESMTASTKTMKAITQNAYGDDVFHLDEIERPEIEADEVLLKVSAAGMDRGTWHVMAGLPYLVRIVGIGFRAPKQKVPGLDVSGTVVAVGADVTRFKEGDEVFGIANGAYAEYASAAEAKLAIKPTNLTFAQAAVVPVSGATALQGIRDVGKVTAGDKVLVVGASGGVGTFAVQVAKSLGAEVTGVASTAKLDLVRSIGADHVIDYTKVDFTDGDERYDVIFDTGGNTPMSDLRSVLTPKGTIVIAGAEDGGKWTGGIGRQVRGLMLSPFISQTLTMFIATEGHENLEGLAELIEAGQITPFIGQTYSLEEVPTAMSDLLAGKARGKISITVQ